MLRKIWAVWRRFAQLLGDIIARILLTLFYFTVMVPFGLGVRWLADPLGNRRKASDSFWYQRRTTDRTLRDARRQHLE